MSQTPIVREPGTLSFMSIGSAGLIYDRSLGTCGTAGQI
jgi:hypothetical protein